MYFNSKITAMFVVIVLPIAITTILTLAAFQFFNLATPGSRESDDQIATTANFELAEKFSDSAIYHALYGATSGEREVAAGPAAGGQVIEFQTILVEPRWIDDSSDFWYAIKKGGSYRYYIVHANRGLKEVLFDTSTLSQAISEQTGEQVDFIQEVPATLAVTGGGNLVRLETAESLIQYDRSTGEISSGPREQAVQYPAYEYSVSPTGEYVVYAREDNLYVRVRGGEDFQLTDDGEPWYGYSKQFGSYDSQAPLRHRLGWIGDSGKFFVERWDNRDVGEMWFIDSLAEPRPTLQTTRFAMPGEGSVPVQELWIFDAEKRTGFRVDTKKWPGQSIGMMDIGTLGFRVSQDEKSLYFGRMSRGFHEVELLKVNVDSGDVEVLIAEKSEPYFTIRMPMFIPLEDTGEVAWLSDRTGRNHYYLYDGNGAVRPITAGDYSVRRPAYFDSEQRFLVAEVFGRDPDAYLFHRQYYRFPLDGGEPIQLTPEDATHEPSFAPDGRFFVDNYSRADQAPRAVLRNLSGELVMELEELDTGPLRAMGFQMQEYFNVKAADGETDLFGVLWKPADFDPTRSYPVIAAVQPNASISAADVARFRPGNVAVQLSQLGFVVVELKTRGQGRHIRDKQFILHSYQNERDYPLADAKAVIEQLSARHPYLDANRVGAYGHSGGGFMSAALCMKYPALFKVCVSSSGNHDNRIAEQNSTEYHWGVIRTPREDGEEWLVNFHPNQELAAGLDGHLLIIHGDNDTDTHFSQSVRLADALIKAGKKFDFMIMPSQDHAYKGVYNEYFDRLRWAYFAEHLMGDTQKLIDLKNL